VSERNERLRKYGRELVQEALDVEPPIKGRVLEGGLWKGGEKEGSL